MHPPYDMTPRFEEKLLKDNLGSGRTIFVGSTTDIGGKWQKGRQVHQVLDHCKLYANTYLFQSKRPDAFLGYTYELPKGCILGTTIETNRDTREISKAPSPALRAMAMCRLRERRAMDLRLNYKLMLSIEPILDFDLAELVDWIAAILPNYVSIGADSKRCNLREPGPGAVASLIEQLREITEVKLKPNLRRLVKGSYFESNGF
jgi:hypothetical protein